MILKNRIKRLAAFMLSAVMSVTLCAAVFADDEGGDPEVELIAEFDSEVFDDDTQPSFICAFGTHEKSPEGTSAKLTFDTEGCELITSELFGYSTIALDKYVCRQSQNGGYYPNYGETVTFEPTADKGNITAHLEIKDAQNNITHQKDMSVLFNRRDCAIAISDEGYEGCEKALDKPLYKVLLFMKTPLSTVTKILLIILLGGVMYCLLHYKDIRRRIRSRKALKKEK
jgi:hypothetical protein